MLTGAEKNHFNKTKIAPLRVLKQLIVFMAPIVKLSAQLVIKVRKQKLTGP